MSFSLVKVSSPSTVGGDMKQGMGWGRVDYIPTHSPWIKYSNFHTLALQSTLIHGKQTPACVIRVLGAFQIQEEAPLLLPMCFESHRAMARGPGCPQTRPTSHSQAHPPQTMSPCLLSCCEAKGWSYWQGRSLLGSPMNYSRNRGEHYQLSQTHSLGPGSA